ncbi:helix-turn-helix transcriptional regulator [Actinoplanes sp. N902-109]|uniref:helix-turn-helix domain-containing protein n=1 Tax=Actinoplanes sp. (strain N902-109) TaxID=649831 RepID=UPI000329464A|nr:helix-turn-helix transcriptional regulator [Actinoplanes sp. N902-109]AGL20851.1 XRE family transcriptional regulator [Actinoplanes sp. N902-109]
MPATRQAPTARLRRLAAELRRLRAESGQTRETIEEKTRINTATLYRIESARVRPQKRTLLALLDLYGVDDEAERERLVGLSRDSRQLDWLQHYEPGLPAAYQTYISFESEANRLQNYESSYIPGLLQTEAYTQEVIRSMRPSETDEGVHQRIKVRRRRQEALHKDAALSLWAVIDEAAIRRTVGGEAVMREQLDHLLKVAESPSVTLQIIPYHAGAHPGMPGAFVVMEFPHDDPALVYTESTSGGLLLEGQADVERYRWIFQRLVAQALSPAETTKLIRSL